MNVLLSIAKETVHVAKDLFKILIPALIVVKILQECGVVRVLSEFVEPVMHLFGLPGEMAIVWTTAMLTNIYAGIAVLMMFVTTLELTTAQMTTLGTMILICHALPVELALSRTVGVRAMFLGPLRILGACLAGWILHTWYSLSGYRSEPAVFRWAAQGSEESLYDWAMNQCVSLIYVLVVLFCLLAVMRVLRAIGATQALGRVLRPLLLLMGISYRGATIAVFGLLAGITFGSGLLIAEARQQALEEKDLVLVLAFLSLCHGIVEDTILIMLIGGQLEGILFFRLFFSILVVAIIARLYGLPYRHLSVQKA